MPHPVEKPPEEIRERHLAVLGVPFVEGRVVEQDGSGEVLFQQSKQENGEAGPKDEGEVNGQLQA